VIHVVRVIGYMSMDGGLGLGDRRSGIRVIFQGIRGLKLESSKSIHFR
jgi:hypothetical protein